MAKEVAFQIVEKREKEKQEEEEERKKRKAVTEEIQVGIECCMGFCIMSKL